MKEMLTLLAWIKETDIAASPERLPVNGEWARYPNGVKKEYYEQADTKEPILVTVVLSKNQCLLGESVDYTITFDQPITVPYIVPISVSDRNNKHITNIGCTVQNGVATGSFIMGSAGDFTVTNEAINFHNTVIEAPLQLTEQPWLRVYQ